MLSDRIRFSTALQFFFFAACFLFAAAPLAPQTFYGSIVGTVTDSSGSVVPGAQVTVTSADSGFRRTMATANDGSYSFLSLVPGVYSVSVTRPGYKSYSRSSITIQVAAAVRIDVVMQVGQVQQQVIVTAAPPLLQTESSTLGEVVGSRTVTEMPLNGRNVLNLASLVPGVVTQGGAAGNLTAQNIFASGNYQINGGTANQNAMYYDGTPIEVTYGNLTALIPTQDAVDEFRVQTNGNDAEYGRYSGGVINLTSKSGTNEFHGSAYEFLRNKVLNANTYFDNSAGIPRPAFTQNQYGASLGGPIKKDRLFFFFNYEGFALRQGQTFVTTVPTEAELNGDFSNYTDGNGNVIPVYDPLTSSCGQIGNPCAAGQQTTRQQFPGNQVPSNRFDPVANYFRVNNRLFAAPNSTSLPYPFDFIANASAGGNNDQVTFRSDWNVSQNQQVFARFTRWGLDELPWDPYRNHQYIYAMDPQQFVTDDMVLGTTYTLNPSTIFDVRVSYLRFHFFQGPPSSLQNLDMTMFGFPAYMNQIVPQFRTNPSIGFPDYQTGSTQIIGSANNNYVMTASLTKIWGRHTVKFGAELRRMDSNYYQDASQAGSWYFDNTFTGSNPVNPGATGSSIAAFLLGYASPGGGYTPSAILTANITAASMRYQGYYLQDTYQATNKLTVNLGLRWDIPGVWTERHDRLSEFDPNMTNMLASSTGLPLKGGFALVNTQAHPARGLRPEVYHLFSPRVGLNYSVDKNTVIRSAFGVFYIPSDAIFEESPFQNAVNFYDNAMITSQDAGVTPSAVLSNPYPGGLVLPPGRSGDFQQILLGQNFSAIAGASPSAISTNWKPAYYLNWNLAIQHNFPGGINLEAAYAASRGVHLPINSDNGVNINQLPDSDLALGNQLLSEVQNPFYGLITSGPLSTQTIEYGQLLRPFPTYQNLVLGADYIGSSDYNALQVKGQKRFGQLGSVLASYTFSKLMTNTETSTDWLEGSVGGALGQIYQDFNNMRGEWSLGMFDVHQSMTGSYVYPLPFGRGQALLANTPAAVNKLIEGWNFEGILTLQRGFPLNIVATPNISNSFGGGLRPNVVPGCNKKSVPADVARVNEYFNTACFTMPAAFSFGDESRTDGALRAPGVANWDVSLMKQTSLTERLKLQFRTEAFNSLNRVQFGSPGQVFTSEGISSFGVLSSQVNNPRLIQFGMRLNF